MTLELNQDLVSYLSGCSVEERERIYIELGEQEWSRCADDVVYWLDSSKHLVPYVHTRDPKPLFACRLCGDGFGHFFDRRYSHLSKRHGIDVEEATEAEISARFEELPTVRPFTMFPYIEPIVRWWLREKIVLIEKSRDMMATWLVVSLYTWDTLFHKNRENIFQSDDSTKTLDLVERAFFIWDNQPAFIKRHNPAVFSAGQTRAGILRVPSLTSTILGFPQGPDQIRQYHPTGVFMDEMAFQAEAEDAFMAVKPAIQAGGRLTGVSSANPGFFYSCCRDVTL